MTKKYKPFATTRQSMDWMARNCDTCTKGFVKIPAKFRCDCERELCAASLEDGQVDEETAKAIGFLDSEGCDLWECPGWERGRK